MNFIIGKIGKTLTFDYQKWGLIGGNCAPVILFTAMASMHPQHNFYIVGKSDFSQLSPQLSELLNKNKNIFDTMSEIDMTKYKKIDQMVNKECDFHKEPIWYLERHNIKIDAGIFSIGIPGSVSQGNIIPKKDGTGLLKTLPIFYTYSCPQIYTLNILDVPFVQFSEDPRYLGCFSKDSFNKKTILLTQKNFGQIKMKNVKSYQDLEQIQTTVPAIYGEIEKIFFTSQTKPSREEFFAKKKILMSLFMNSHGFSAKESRYGFVQKYVHTHFPQTIVYGNWPDEITSTDQRFKKVRMGNIQHIVKDTKYTVVTSIMPGFVTCKPWQMIQFGIVPFITKDYDPERLLPLPQFLYIEDENDLKTKINLLESDESCYNKLREQLYSLLEDDYYSGVRMNNIFFNEINKLMGTNIDFSPTKENEVKISSFIENKKNR